MNSCVHRAFVLPACPESRAPACRPSPLNPSYTLPSRLLRASRLASQSMYPLPKSVPPATGPPAAYKRAGPGLGTRIAPSTTCHGFTDSMNSLMEVVDAFVKLAARDTPTPTYSLAEDSDASVWHIRPGTFPASATEFAPWASPDIAETLFTTARLLPFASTFVEALICVLLGLKGDTYLDTPDVLLDTAAMHLASMSLGVKNTAFFEAAGWHVHNPSVQVCGEPPAAGPPLKLMASPGVVWGIAMNFGFRPHTLTEAQCRASSFSAVLCPFPAAVFVGVATDKPLACRLFYDNAAPPDVVPQIPAAEVQSMMLANIRMAGDGDAMRATMAREADRKKKKAAQRKRYRKSKTAASKWSAPAPGSVAAAAAEKAARDAARPDFSPAIREHITTNDRRGENYVAKTLPALLDAFLNGDTGYRRANDTYCVVSSTTQCEWDPVTDAPLDTPDNVRGREETKTVLLQRDVAFATARAAVWDYLSHIEAQGPNPGRIVRPPEHFATRSNCPHTASVTYTDALPPNPVAPGASDESVHDAPLRCVRTELLIYICHAPNLPPVAAPKPPDAPPLAQ